MAYDFTRASSQNLIATTAPVTTYPLSIACWFNLDDTTNIQAFVSVTDDDGIATNDAFVLRARGDSGGDPIEVVVVENGTASTVSTSTTGYSAGAWFHACGLFDTANIHCYINGGSKSVDVNPVSNPSAIDTVIIGNNRSGGGSACDGRIAEVGIWDAILTPSEVALLADGFSPVMVRPASLVFYAPLARELVDRVGGLSLSNVNGAVVAAHPRVYNPHRRFIQGKVAAGTTGEAALTGSSHTAQQTAPSVVFNVPL